MRGVTHGAGDFADVHLGRSIGKAFDIALIFRVPVGNFQAEGYRFRVNAMRAPNLRRVAKLLRAAGEDVAELGEGGRDEARGIADEQSLGGVHNVVRRHAVVQPACGDGIADGFADVHGERDDVVLDLDFQFIDASSVTFRLGANHGGGFGGNLAGFGERFSGGQLDFEPLGVFVGVAPDAAHLFAGVAWNQANPLFSGCQANIAHLDSATVR